MWDKFQIFFLLAILSGLVGGFLEFPQVLKIFKRKSAGDISIITYSTLFIGSCIWVVYGSQIKNIPLLITNIIGGINVFLIMIGWYTYGGKLQIKKLKNKIKRKFL